MAARVWQSGRLSRRDREGTGVSAACIGRDQCNVHRSRTRCYSDSICTGGSEATVGAESDVPLKSYATVVVHRKALLT
jgi:hypothetical protein